MTDDKTRQEGPPAADPIRQETAAQEPPATDQASAEPVKKKRGRPKKKIIIIQDHSPMTDDKKAAEGQEPGKDWQDMTPHEFIEYAQDNPEAAKQDVKDYFSTGKGKEAAENLITAAQTLQETAEAFNNARNLINETSARIVARRMAAAQFDISKIVDAIVRANKFTLLTNDGDAEALDRFYNEFDELEPFINAILDDDPARKGMNADQLLESIPLWALFYIDNPGAVDEKAEDAQEAANIKAVIEIIQKARAARDAKKAEEEQKQYEPAKIRGTDKIDYPVDKPNNNMWDNVWRTLKENPDGQLTFSFDVKKRGEKEELPLLVSINFDALQDIEITKRLTPFDKRVYIAISALFNAGNEVITLSTIYKHMGYRGRPGGSDLERIHKSVMKMLAAQITVDNEIEIQRHKKYGHFKYRGALLPVELGEFYNVQGALTDAAMHILREPPLMTFARNRDQITNVSLKLLQSPVSKTDANLLLEDYLIVQLKRAQKGKAHGRVRMLYKTIYKHARIPEKPTTNTEKSARQRAPGKIEKYLKHYKAEGTITNYATDKDGITLFW